MVIEGVRESIKDVSTYVYGKTVEEIKDDYGLESIAKLCFNENPYAPYPCCREAIKNEMDKLNCYPDSKYVELKEIIGNKLNLSKENVALSHGIVGILETLSKMFLESGDEVIIPESTFGLYEDLSKTMGAKIKRTKIRDGKIDIEDILSNITPKTKLIWISNPNNPTGTIINKDEFDYLITNIPDHVWIIFDEAYYEFAAGGDYPDSVSAVQEGEKIILTRTFSKGYGMAGLRLGYALAHEKVIDTINRVSQPFNSNRAALAGAKAVLENESCSREAINKINESKKHITSELKELGCKVFPSYTNFIFFKTPYPAENIINELLQNGVMVTPGTAWGYEKGVRVSIGKPEENERFLNELKKLIIEE